MFQYNVLSRTNLTGDIYGNDLKTARRKLTAAEIKALFTTPIELIPAPGAGFITWIAHTVAFLDYSTAAFTGDHDLIITDASGVEVTAEIPYAMYQNTADVLHDIANVNNTTRVLDEAISISAETADPGGATAASTLTLTIFYMTIKAT
uniref:Uncharacterized protein n=1 Tax=viral metagenome TaxID=1070528 RepID=A0A6M3IIT5_9ZZZZ